MNDSPQCPQCGCTELRVWWKVDVSALLLHGQVIEGPDTCDDEPYPADELCCRQCGFIADRENYYDLLDSLDILLAAQLDL